MVVILSTSCYILGNNELTDEYFINVQELYTFLIGTCYVIKSNIQMPPPVFLKMTLKFNDTLNEVDLQKVNIPTQFCNLQHIAWIWTGPEWPISDSKIKRIFEIL